MIKLKSVFLYERIRKETQNCSQIRAYRRVEKSKCQNDILQEYRPTVEMKCMSIVEPHFRQDEPAISPLKILFLQKI